MEKLIQRYVLRSVSKAVFALILCLPPLFVVFVNLKHFKHTNTLQLKSSHQMRPYRLTITSGSDKPINKIDSCDVRCTWGPFRETATFDAILYKGEQQVKNLSFFYSMEPSWILKLLYGDLFLNNLKNEAYSIRFNFGSEAPCPYFAWYAFENLKVKPLPTLIKGATFLASHNHTQYDRAALAKELSKYIPLYAYGNVLHNIDFPLSARTSDPNPKNWNKTAVLRKYMFHFAFENSVETDYVSEKVWAALAAGTVPVYYGAPNAIDFLPEHSAVFIRDFDSTEDAGKYLMHLLKNDTAYNEYHKWRYSPFSLQFLRRWNFTHTDRSCRICRWAFAKLLALPYNVEQQSIEFAKHFK